MVRDGPQPNLLHAKEEVCLCDEGNRTVIGDAVARPAGQRGPLAPRDSVAGRTAGELWTSDRISGGVPSPAESNGLRGNSQARTTHAECDSFIEKRRFCCETGTYRVGWSKWRT